jgi:predicted exporter
MDMEEGSDLPARLAPGVRVGLALLGLALIGAAAIAAYYLLLLLVGTGEHSELSGREEAMVWSALLLPLLLLASAVASLLCRTRRGLRVLGTFGAAAAANLLVVLYLYRLDTLPPPCPVRSAAPGASLYPNPVDATGCLSRSRS